MSKTVTCQTCGKTINVIDSYRNEKGLMQCIDCAKPLYCHKCNNRIYHENPISRIATGRFCEKCLFPEDSNVTFNEFLQDYKSHKVAIKNYNKKATIIKALFIAASILLYISIALFLTFSLKKGQVFYFVSLLVWIFITVRTVNKYVLKCDDLNITEFYSKKFPSNSTIRIDDLYIEYRKEKKLNKSDLSVIQKDFIQHSTLTIPTNNAGKYQIRRQQGHPGFNGYIVFNPTTFEVKYFDVFLSSKESLEVIINEEFEIKTIGCEVKPVLEQESAGAVKKKAVAQAKPVNKTEPTVEEKKTTPTPTGKNPSALNEIINKIEKINDLYKKGIISQEEFEKLKQEIMESIDE